MMTKNDQVTKHKQVEKTLEEELKFLWRAIDTSPNFIFIRDREGKFLMVNKAMAQAYGTTAENITGKTDADFNPNPEKIEELLQDDREVMDSLQEKNIPERLITTPTGEKRWMHIIKRPLVDKDGVARRVLGIANDITEQVELEQKIRKSMDRRGDQLQLTTEIAQDIGAAPGLEEIYKRVVTLVKERFNYYHTQIFRHEVAKNAMVVVEGYGPVGKKMVENEHSLPYGRGVVGTAAATGEPVLASDVAEDPYWVPHPDLPDTQGELAVPIKWQNEVLGILDVQSNQAGSLTEEDQMVLMGLAGQIASAIVSSRLFARIETRYRISRELNTATDESEMLQVLTQPTIKSGIDSISLAYLDLNEKGKPEWAEIVANWYREEKKPTQIGMRFHLPALPFSNLLIAHPNDPQFVSNVNKDKRIAENDAALLAQSGSQAIAIVPLNQAGNWVGFISFSWNTPHEFSVREKENYQALINLVSPVIASRRAYSKAEAARVQTNMLYNLSSELNMATNDKEILQSLVQPAIKAGAIDADLQYIESDSEGTPKWVKEVASWNNKEGAQAAILERRIPITQRVLAPLWMENPKTPSFITDAATDERLNAETQELLLKNNSRARVIIPLFQAGRWAGIINFTWNKVHSFDEQEKEIYYALVGLATAAVTSRQLLAQAETRARREQTLREIAANIRETSEVNTVLQSAVQQLGETLRRPTFIRLGNAEELSQPPKNRTGKNDNKGGE